MKEIFLAGGCFWGLQRFFDQFEGVISTEVGYANGHGYTDQHAPSYEEVCRNSGHAETVKVIYDENLLSLPELLRYFFMVIDPVSVNQQGNDRGIQYRTGIYFTEMAQLREIRPVYDTEQEKAGQPLAVELQPIKNFQGSDYDRYQKYIKPAVEAYHLAVKAGQHPSDKELDRIYFDADNMEYKLNKRNAPYEEQISYISGHELLSDFGFHDSRFVSFEHTGNKAFLKLDYNGRVATFLFEDVESVQSYYDADNSWVFDFCCYPTADPAGTGNNYGIVFDIELYRIICAKVTVVSCANV